MKKGRSFYRCWLCKSIVSQWDIREHGGCRKCGNRKVSPSNLSWFEMIVQIIKHPKVWQWEEDQIIPVAEFPGEPPDDGTV